MRCDVCERELPARDQNPWHPFCSERCKLVDLGRWLGEAYVIEGPPSPTEMPSVPEEVPTDDDEDRGPAPDETSSV